ncbi:MAG: transcription antitermination factor NusB [Spirochaetaceae bacterium]|jgi:N utilization substance protein B|nr:transcription antitermination factor NusB [Spirochaetaceae bacterium]
MASRRQGRILAFQSLYSWEAGGQVLPVPEELFAFSWLSDEKIASLERGTAAFSRLLLTGTIENIDAVDGMIRNHLKNWDNSRLGKVDLAVLRMSVYALMFERDVPASIVIDEAIGIAKEYGTDDSFRFVNGVLDSIRKTIQTGNGQTGDGQANHDRYVSPVSVLPVPEREG